MLHICGQSLLIAALHSLWHHIRIITDTIHGTTITAAPGRPDRSPAGRHATTDHWQSDHCRILAPTHYWPGHCVTPASPDRRAIGSSIRQYNHYQSATDSAGRQSLAGSAVSTADTIRYRTAGFRPACHRLPGVQHHACGTAAFRIWHAHQVLHWHRTSGAHRIWRGGIGFRPQAIIRHRACTGIIIWRHI